MTNQLTSDPNQAAPKPSAWSPFRHKAFTILWVSTVASNIGTWMHDVGAGWLMTELSSSPSIVSLVQASTTLPVFLFALLAGAIADIVDRRRMLIAINMAMATAGALMATLVAAGLMTPILLLLFTFVFGTGAAFMAPAWQAIVPSLVSRADLSAAVSLNSMGINISRAIGPALAGVIIVSIGLAAPFIINALSFIGIVLALLWWKPPPKNASGLPPEHVFGAMRAGVQYAMNSGPLKQTLVRAAGFFLCASAYWAMLPLIAKDVLGGGASLYGVLLGSVGAGAVAGAFAMPAIRRKLGPDKTVAAGALGTAAVLALFAVAPMPAFAAIAAAVGGIAWIAVLSTLNVSAQTALPDWVRARGLSIFLTVFFGSMALGSLIWGQIATATSIETALLLAAAGAVVAVPLTWRAKLARGEALDFSPSMHWPAPIVTGDPVAEDRPVIIQITYTIRPEDREPFAEAMQEMAAARRRQGAFGWRLMQDAALPERFVEIWHEASWINHLRHHERVTVSDKAIQDSVHAMHQEAELPRVEHFVAPITTKASE